MEKEHSRPQKRGWISCVYIIECKNWHLFLLHCTVGRKRFHFFKRVFSSSSDYDRVVDRKNDIIYHDRTEFDEFVAVLVSDYAILAKSLIKLAEENGASKEAVQMILKEKTNVVFLATGKQGRYDDLVKGRVDVDFVARLERKNDSHTISNKTFDFSKTTIQQLIQDGYKESKEQMKEVLARAIREM
jgi:NTE family protein